jgi:hypothetical protein
VNRYVESDDFATLTAETERLKQALAEIRYCLLIGDSRVLACRHEGEPDYAAKVTATFAKFAQGAPRSYLVDFPDYAEMNHVEAAILNRVARRYPELFAELTAHGPSVSCIISPASGCRCPAGGRNCSCATTSSPISRRRRTSAT